MTRNYNSVAAEYDRLYTSPEYLKENDFIREKLAEIHEPQDVVLDIGCGTGLGAELLPDADYVGVDIAIKMIEIARKKSGKQFELLNGNSISLKPYSLIIAIFGAASYLSWCRIEEIRNSGKKYFLMFYLENYKPKTKGYGIIIKNNYTANYTCFGKYKVLTSER